MKVRLATQVFSYSVHVGMSFYIRFGYLPVEATETAHFVNRMDKLFDILNSSETSPSKKYNSAFKGEPFQMEFLMECWSSLKNLRFETRIILILPKK